MGVRGRLEVCQLSYLISLQNREKWHSGPRECARRFLFQPTAAFVWDKWPLSLSDSIMSVTF